MDWMDGDRELRSITRRQNTQPCTPAAPSTNLDKLWKTTLLTGGFPLVSTVSKSDMTKVPVPFRPGSFRDTARNRKSTRASNYCCREAVRMLRRPSRLICKSIPVTYVAARFSPRPDHEVHLFTACVSTGHFRNGDIAHLHAGS